MPLLLADFIHIKVCKPNLRKTLDTTEICIASQLFWFGGMIMRNYFEFLMKQLLLCSKNYYQMKEPVVEEIEEKQIKLEFS